MKSTLETVFKIILGVELDSIAEAMKKRLDFLMFLMRRVPLTCFAMSMPFGRSKGY